LLWNQSSEGHHRKQCQCNTGPRRQGDARDSVLGQSCIVFASPIASILGPVPGIHTRLTGCSSQVKMCGAKSLQSFHQGKIRTCLFSLGRDTATHENRALLRAHFLVHGFFRQKNDSSDEGNNSSRGKMILQAGKMRRSATFIASFSRPRFKPLRNAS
jgi:hypothetical protein